jgi:hypothetical protein
MKTEYAKVFAALAVEKVNRANAMGTKTTWTTEDHNRALAKCLAEADIPADVKPEAVFYEVIADVSNPSAFGQFLEKKFAGTGHFVRKDGKAKTVSALESELDAALAASKPAPTPEA